ncbi:MAG: hypothetical protein RSE18_02445 [Acinetobacter sp.]
MTPEEIKKGAPPTAQFYNDEFEEKKMIDLNMIQDVLGNVAKKIQVNLVGENKSIVINGDNDLEITIEYDKGKEKYLIIIFGVVYVNNREYDSWAKMIDPCDLKETLKHVSRIVKK